MCLDHSSAAFFFFVAEKKDTDRERQRFVMTEENYECMFFSAVFLAIVFLQILYQLLFY